MHELPEKMRRENHLPYQTHSSIIQHVQNYWLAALFVTFELSPCPFEVSKSRSCARTYIKTLHWKSFKNRAVGKEERTLCALAEKLFWQHFKSERILVEVLWVLCIEKREFFRLFVFGRKIDFLFTSFCSWPWKAEKAFNQNANKTLNEINGSTISKSISASSSYQGNGFWHFIKKETEEFSFFPRLKQTF